eukprot:TRINITY_DN30177_c0_g1_i1.p1 TRINITY_DN30177_c0_g1~~TRINITY_DN30177_c0_g1_i1.p1  ORF type:complete len:351 (+),score=86.19 TRINITY_DN30177_c0_g1_i1:66-1118(+)
MRRDAVLRFLKAARWPYAGALAAAALWQSRSRAPQQGRARFTVLSCNLLSDGRVSSLADGVSVDAQSGRARCLCDAAAPTAQCTAAEIAARLRTVAPQRVRAAHFCEAYAQYIARSDVLCFQEVSDVDGLSRALAERFNGAFHLVSAVAGDAAEEWACVYAQGRAAAAGCAELDVGADVRRANEGLPVAAAAVGGTDDRAVAVVTLRAAPGCARPVLRELQQQFGGRRHVVAADLGLTPKQLHKLTLGLSIRYEVPTAEKDDAVTQWVCDARQQAAGLSSYRAASAHVMTNVRGDGAVSRVLPLRAAGPPPLVPWEPTGGHPVHEALVGNGPMLTSEIVSPHSPIVVQYS